MSSKPRGSIFGYKRRETLIELAKLAYERCPYEGSNLTVLREDSQTIIVKIRRVKTVLDDLQEAVALQDSKLEKANFSYVDKEFSFFLNDDYELVVNEFYEKSIQILGEREDFHQVLKFTKDEEDQGNRSYLVSNVLDKIK